MSKSKATPFQAYILNQLVVVDPDLTEGEVEEPISRRYHKRGDACQHYSLGNHVCWWWRYMLPRRPSVFETDELFDTDMCVFSEDEGGYLYFMTDHVREISSRMDQIRLVFPHSIRIEAYDTRIESNQWHWDKIVGVWTAVGNIQVSCRPEPVMQDFSKVDPVLTEMITDQAPFGILTDYIKEHDLQL
jgi:hypothetical protein